MNENHYLAIMAGGIGSRFWPKSRQDKPKQFLDILNTGRTLIQTTVDRYKNFIPEDNIYIITSRTYADIVQEQLPDLKQKNIILEPSRKNTAPCVALISQKIQAANPNAVLIVAPSDHLIMREQIFQNLMLQAMDFAATNDVLLTLGILPTRAETGYGYIQYEQQKSLTEGIHKVKTFTEKPPLELAMQFIESGDFLWNSGMFIWSAKAINEAFRKLQPEIHGIFQEGEDLWNTESESAFIDKAYSLCSNISIDYAIMEKANNVYVLPADIGWNDLGSWQSLYEEYSPDSASNAVAGKNIMLFDTEHCMIMGQDHKLTVLQGMENFNIIDTPQALLIFKRGDDAKIKEILADVKRQKGQGFL